MIKTLFACLYVGLFVFGLSFFQVNGQQTGGRKHLDVVKSL